MRKPSVLFLNRTYPPFRGATGRLLRDLARSMAREGWQVTVITTGPASGEDYDGAVRVIRIRAAEKPGGAFSFFRIWALMLKTALRQDRPDLLVTMTDPPMLAVIGRIVSTARRTRHLHWCQDLYPDVLPALGIKLPGFVMKALQRLSRGALKRADRVIVIGRCMAGRLGGGGIDLPRITVIPNWPDAELTFPLPREGFNGASLPDGEVYDEVLNGYRSHGEQVKHGPKFRVLYAGNIGRAHPIDTIMDAAEILGESHPEIEFVFVGDGPRHNLVARQRAQRHLDNIRLIPYQPASRLKDLMESGDVHLVSMEETARGTIVPSKLYAALAVHRPCIFLGPDRCEAAQVIEDFGCGAVIAQGDAEGLAEQIRQLRLSSDAWFAAHRGAAAASRMFTPGAAIHAWIDRAAATLDERPAGAPDSDLQKLEFASREGRAGYDR